jgi:hypothetical protein
VVAQDEHWLSALADLVALFESNLPLSDPWGEKENDLPVEGADQDTHTSDLLINAVWPDLRKTPRQPAVEGNAQVQTNEQTVEPQLAEEGFTFREEHHNYH